MRRLPTQLTCEQIYDVWATEPYLLRIFDIRPADLFVKSHIPGSIWMTESELFLRLSARTADAGGSPGHRLSSEDVLAVVIATEEQQARLEGETCRSLDVVLMKDCGRWSELGMPTFRDGMPFAFNENLQFEKGDTMGNDAIFFQLFESESSTYTYLIGDPKTKEAALIDPVLETVDRDLKLVDELGLKLLYVLDTHVHADHVTAADVIRERTGAKTAVSKDAKVQCADIALEDGQEILVGDKKIRVISTPGHTDSCLSFYFEGRVFTGDALLIRGTGRTDFQQGSAEKLYESIHGKIFNLPADTKIYPAHDYRGQTVSSVALEREFNPRVGGKRTQEDFVKIMSELKLANPKKIHEAVPANLACGKLKEARTFKAAMVDGVPEVSVEEVHRNLGKAKLIDVRQPDEFNADLGHIKGARLVTLGPELTAFLANGDRSEELVFVCRSGRRSNQATAESLAQGYKFSVNMGGGMLRWNEAALPVERA